jgi:hypothetical protein
MGIFDDVVQGITKEVTKVQARSQEMLQVYNLTSQIREIERKKSAKLMEIGKLIFDKYQRNIAVLEETLKDKVSEIAGLEQQISELSAELEGLRMASDPNTPASKRAEAKAGYTATPGFECPRCHAAASREKSFCPTCGESLKPGEDIVDVEPDGRAVNN